MTTRAPVIVWEKWVDPFGMDDENTIDENQFFDDDEDGGIAPDEQNTMDGIENQFIKKTKHIRAISTPMGIIPLEETLPSGKIFNFWTGHTNFTITKNIAFILEKTDGVESLDIFTRYRFRVGIGKLFDDGDVMRDINSRVYEHLS